MSLAAIILTALFQFVANQGTTHKKFAKVEEKMIQQTILEARLGQILSSKPKTLFTHEKSVFIRYKPLLDPDPSFNDLCWAQIECKDGALKQHLWSFDLKKNRTEVIFNDLDLVEWEFWDSPKWRKDWPKKLNKVPSMIRLNVIKKEKKLEFAFLLDVSRPILIEKAV